MNDLSKAGQASRGPKVGAPSDKQPGSVSGGDAVKPDWDRNRRHSSFRSGLDMQAAATETRRVLEAEGWTLSAGAALTDTTAADIEAVADTASIAARRATSRAAQLRPLDESARRLLGTWSLKDSYPTGIARGGCVLATFDYGLVVRLSPIEQRGSGGAADPPDETQSLPRGTEDPPDETQSLPRGTEDPPDETQVDVWCQESISPFRGKFPDPRRFSIGSELEALDPSPILKDHLQMWPPSNSNPATS